MLAAKNTIICLNPNFQDYRIFRIRTICCRWFSTRGLHMVSFQLTQAGSLQCACREIRCANLAAAKNNKSKIIGE
jgi:hypothetical protein